MGLKRCKLSRKTQLRLLEFFVLEVTARSAADVLGLQANTVALFYRKVRELIVEQAAANEELLGGEVEVKESYFGGVRKGKRGRGALGKVPVFSLLKRRGKVFVIPISDAKATTLMPIIRKIIQPDSIVYTDTFGSYSALDVSEFHHSRINHSKLFADKQNHINGIENFWNQAKRVLRKYNGIPRQNFFLFIKECEFRFNHGSPKQQLKTLRGWANL
ncbi:IS1595 family transposase [Asticcacaulis excentricus]|uniref:Transposase n=1 Tax=Asticcacaulis excentricus (strain ATCC 15261 / DSM 4724 / KCTC 12464 / NCIMB 9791 / VKM B-1370 / CB 48) TaxID=573065 RepID=E8RSX1_ASTEC|nr:IS1595 family transposase [Asticcacaulis excentricus]ADU14592.1 transposase [Asticcacaulis excentricus CB 48]